MNTPQTQQADSQVKVQIPLSKQLRDAVEAHALQLGFSSVQDFTRVMYATVLRDDVGLSLVSSKKEPTVRLSKAAEQRYSKQLASLPERLTSGEAKAFNDVESLLADLQ